MTWFLIILLALSVFVMIALVLRAPRPTWEVVGIALLLGLAGYALQGSPGQPGAPKAAAETIDGAGAAAAVAARQQLGQGGDVNDKHLIIADALARHGQFADAAEVLRGAVEQSPGNGAAWLAMGNALVGHADGTISPAATFAYGRAALADPASPGPSFFMGLALLGSGRFDEGRAQWADLLARSPKDAPWRGDLEKRLGELDSFLSRRGGAAGLVEPPRN